MALGTDLWPRGRGSSSELSRPRVDREAALAAADRMFGVEQQVKRAHLGLLIRIKNTLTGEQQEELEGLRAGV